MINLWLVTNCESNFVVQLSMFLSAILSPHDLAFPFSSHSYVGVFLLLLTVDLVAVGCRCQQGTDLDKGGLRNNRSNVEMKTSGQAYQNIPVVSDNKKQED